MRTAHCGRSAAPAHDAAGVQAVIHAWGFGHKVATMQGLIEQLTVRITDTQ